MPRPRTHPDKIRVVQSPIHGRGIVATGTIRKGTRIIEYAGERVSNEEADRRYEGIDESFTTLFTLDDDTVIDAESGGNEARFINHSCDPNCQAVHEGDAIYIYALRTIREGEELTYDYKLHRPGRFRKAWLELYGCRCGADSCRGTMLDRPRPRKKRSPG